MKSAFCNSAFYNARSQRYAATGRPRAHKRSGWHTQIGWW